MPASLRVARLACRHSVRLPTTQHMSFHFIGKRVFEPDQALFMTPGIVARDDEQHRIKIADYPQYSCGPTHPLFRDSRSIRSLGSAEWPKLDQPMISF
jgi:hypothetical protein